MGFLLFVRHRFAVTQGETLYTLAQHSPAVKLRLHYRTLRFLIDGIGPAA
jgi:hypothetical protein